MRRWYLVGLLLAAGALRAAEPAESVAVLDGGPKRAPATFECTPGHPVETHLIRLGTGSSHYTIRYCGCQDPSHGEQRPAAEGNVGMPEPVPSNWYWGGFLFIDINGKNATAYRQTEMRVIDQGGRGAFQMIFAHPDAEVGVRFAMLPGENHLLALVKWWPKPGGAPLQSVTVRTTCYPSFFTAARHRQGERHVKTPRTDKKEGEAMPLTPAEDTWLYYYDTVFDPARGEGDGPCAALVDPAAVKDGSVSIGSYAVVTTLNLKPEAGEARLGFYDFSGHTNAEADAYLKAHGADDSAELHALDFRPDTVRSLDAAALRAETERLLTEAADDAATYRAQATELLAKVADLQPKAAGGDWHAEADLATAVNGSADLFWKLKMMAALNAP